MEQRRAASRVKHASLGGRPRRKTKPKVWLPPFRSIESSPVQDESGTTFVRSRGFMRHFSDRFVLVPAFLLAAGVAIPAQALTPVPGSANPNLSGRAPAYSCCSGDTSPAQAAVQFLEFGLEECASLKFAVEGKVSFAPGVQPGNNPDGDNNFGMTNYGDGISAPVTVRDNSLLGVFLGSASPTGSATPGRLDFGTDIAFQSLAPEIGQIFFIGDGLTSDSKTGATDGLPQAFVVPKDATRLFLGTADGVGWFNNSGSFSVSATSTAEARTNDCGDPAGSQGITAGDALHVLRTGVGTASCDDCVCDVDESGSVAASDALAVLRESVDQPVNLHCSCCSPPDIPTTTTTTIPCSGEGEHCTQPEDCCSGLLCIPTEAGSFCFDF
jgi:hypothetical protein